MMALTWQNVVFLKCLAKAGTISLITDIEEKPKKVSINFNYSHDEHIQGRKLL